MVSVTNNFIFPYRAFDRTEGECFTFRVPVAESSETIFTSPEDKRPEKSKCIKGSQAASKCLKVDLAVPSRPLASAHQPSPASRRYLFKSSSCPGFLSLKLNIYVAVKNVKGGILVGRSSPVSEPVTLRYDVMKLVLRFLKETPACKPSGHPPSGQSCHRGLCWHP